MANAKIINLGNLVWEDKDADGVQDAGEYGYGGLTVTLWSQSGTTWSKLSTATTSTSGIYKFDGLDEGKYKVQFSLPTGYGFTTSAGLLTNTINSDANQATGYTNEFSLVYSTTVSDHFYVDAGIYKLGTINSWVWNDTDMNGIQDKPKESGLSQVTIKLYSELGTTALKTTTSDNTGAFTLSDIQPGKYRIEFVKSGYQYSPKDAGNDDKLDSDANTTGYTDVFTVVSGDNLTQIAAGMYRKPSLGDKVWWDKNANGKQDSGESGISGVAVQLYSGTTLVDSKTTDVNGLYQFDNITPGSYTVKFGTHPDYVLISNKDVAGVSDALDSDADKTTGYTDVFTLKMDEINTSIDVGLYAKADFSSIGDYVWLDSNRNGKQDDGINAGVANVTVELYGSNGSKVSTTVTNAQGYYQFTEIIAGNYRVKFIPPSDKGYSFTTQQAAGTNTSDDSNANTSGYSNTFTVGKSVTLDDIDAGLVVNTTANLGDFVWHDSNLNGTQDNNEPGIAGAVVRLYDENKKFTGLQTFTDSKGYYLFKDIPAAKYTMWISAVDDKYVATEQDKTTDDKDSDIDINTWWTAPFDVIAGKQDLTRDAGFVQKGSIGDNIWYDNDANGVYTGGGDKTLYWTYTNVYLYDKTGSTLLNQTQTNAGVYTFNNVRPGEYKVKFDEISGYKFTHKDAEFDGYGSDTTDSDANPDTGFTDVFQLGSGENKTTIDAAYTPSLGSKAALGNFVWHDADGNGTYTYGEAGVPNIQVQLTDKNGNVLAQYGSRYTDASGVYSFVNIEPGDYRIKFTSPYPFTKANIGPDGSDSDPDPTTGLTDVVTVRAGEINYSVDAGVYVNASIGDFVWADTNRDGQLQWGSGERGIGNVKVELYDATSSTLLQTTTTASTTSAAFPYVGMYKFSNLAPGEYKVKFYAPDSYLGSPKNNTANDAYDSDADSATGWTDIIKITSNQNISSIDAAFYQLTPNMATVGDRVWLDSNGNGLQDNGEVGIAKATVKLYNSTGTLIATTSTDANGYYRFSEIIPGDYKVQFTKPAGLVLTQTEVGSDRNLDADQQDASGYTQVFSLSANQTKLDVDAGYFKPGSIGNRVWHDVNQDGLSVGENGISGVTVQLYDATGTTQLGSTVTDNSGYYVFNNLAAASYKVKFGSKNGMLFSPAQVGNDKTIDSDANISTGFSNVIKLAAGEVNNDIDAGLYAPVAGGATIGDRVWHDKNGDGQQGKISDEPGVANVTVMLYQANNLTTPLKTTTTDANGIYRFAKLELGDYKVKFSPQAGNNWQFTRANIGNDGSDSDADATTGLSSTISLTRAGECNNTIDAGLYQGINIGDFVWLDNDGNGQQGTSATEKTGIANVSVTLYRTDGSVVAQTLTDNSGKYHFNNVTPGNYKLHFALPDSYGFTQKNIGADNTDSDADPQTGYTDVFTLTSGQADDLSLDAGMMKLGSIGDRVWLEKLQTGATMVNGIQDTNEQGLALVEVELWQKVGGTYQFTGLKTETDPNGNYLFNKLPAGDYGVKFTTPKGYLLTYQNQGNQEALDSDAEQTTGFAYVTLASGENNRDIDAGFLQASRIGDRIWGDHSAFNGARNAIDLDGIQQPDEWGQPYSLVWLQDSTGKILAFTQTDLEGHYSFDVMPGTYRVLMTCMNGAQVNVCNSTTQNAYGNQYESLDSDIVDRVYNSGMLPSDWVTIGYAQDYKDLDGGFTPLAIDLNNNGIQTLARTANSATFDLFGNGTPVQSGWIAAEDGMLAIDLDGNDKIDNINELFGGIKQGDGFSKLARFDSNADSIVNAQDTRFAELCIWQDLNSNHATDAGELKSLAEIGISSLNVNYLSIPELDRNGNVHLERSSVTLTNGSSQEMTDVYFNVAQADAQAAGITLPSLAELLSNNHPLEMQFGPASNGHLVSTIYNHLKLAEQLDWSTIHGKT